MMLTTQTPIQRNETHATIVYAVLAMALVGAVIFFVRLPHSDVDFCRSVFTGLAKGRASAQHHIDWQHLKAMGIDVGASYTGFRSEFDRVKYKKWFIQGFADGFARTGAEVGFFTNWRVAKRDGTRTTIEVDYPRLGKTLLFVIQSNGKKLVEEIQWKDVHGPG